MDVPLTVDELRVLYDLMSSRALKFRSEAAYVAYSSAYNNSPKRCEERTNQIKAAEEAEALRDKLAAALIRLGQPLFDWGSVGRKL